MHPNSEDELAIEDGDIIPLDAWCRRCGARVRRPRPLRGPV